MASKKRKPLGKSIKLEEADSDEAATPTPQDMSRADELASTNPLLNAFWLADSYEPKEGEK
jgi:hypothetical protein